MPFASPYPDVEIPAVSVFDYLFGDLSDADRRRPAFVSGAETQLTYGELVTRIETVAGGLSARGIGVGDVVGIYAPNSPEFAIALHGILRAGATATTINALYTPEEAHKQLIASGAKALFTINAAAKSVRDLLGDTQVPEQNVLLIDGENIDSLAALVAQAYPAPHVEFDPTTHLAVLPYSSGTTGVPKGVKLSHTNLVANIAQMLPPLKLSSDDVVLAVLPFFHIYGLTVLLNSTLRARASLAVMPKFDLIEFLTLVQTARCSFVFIAPPVAVALAKHPIIDSYDLSSIKTIISGAAPLDGQLAEAVAERLGCEVGQGFGMSELSPVSHVIPTGDAKAPRQSVGLALPNVTCKIVDPDTGEEVAYPSGEGVSEPGELWVAGPNVMLGYLNNEVATAETIDADGYLHTGDIATVDADGYVTIVDRLKELIKYKGYQVPPAELEALLLSHPSIADAAVIGVNDDEGEEVPKAFVVLQPDVSLSADEVKSFVAERVAPYKKVRQVEFIAEVPKSAAGKILRKDLRARR